MMIKTLKGVLGGLAVAALAVSVSTAPLQAQDGKVRPDGNKRVGEVYIPTIWVDPDGCEHWVMDDGAEGYGDNRRNRDGTPVCHRREACGVVPTDHLFATDRSAISPAGRESLKKFFKSTNAFGYLIYGHTDARASDEYNMRLSKRRANAVAKVGRSIGARIVDVKGFGERKPRATNSTAAGMKQNRRVEIYCLR